jgi:two-component system, NtrC family, sensor kinase
MGFMHFAKKEQPRAAEELDEPWNILIVDDESSVHEMTRLVLKNFTYNNKGLDFTSAYSGKEAIEQLTQYPNRFAIVLLDVIMESDDAGLIVTQKIREELLNDEIRIILRTGQPGMFPEQEIVEKYDINDYKEKTDLTSVKLYTLMRTSLKAYEAVMLSKNYAHQLEEQVAQEIAKNQEQEKMILAQTKQAAAGEVLSMIASQWREPLAVISASANNMLIDLQLGEEIPAQNLEKELNGIVQEMTSLSETIEQFQNYFSESESEQAFSLNLYIEDLCKFSQSLLKMFKIALLQELDRDIEVSFPKSAFSQVFVTIIRSVYDVFKRRKNEHVNLQRSIIVRSHIDEEWFSIEIADNAGELEPLSIEHIFEPNFTANAEFEHVGHGLYLSKITVEEELGGTIAVENTQEGCRFSIKLPRIHVKPEDKNLNALLD